MKLRVLLFILTSLSIFSLHAQVCFDSVGISTDPRPGKAYNNERPELANRYTWMDKLISPVSLVGRPFNQLDSYSNPYFNNSIDLNYLAKADSSDFHPEDGWEMVLYGFGVGQDGNMFQNGGTLPNLILYNRHSGMLHVFTTSNSDELGLFGTKLIQTLPGLPKRSEYGVSGIFGLMQPLAQPLDDSTTTFVVQTNSLLSRSGLQLMHSAFPMAYDPCVCNQKMSIKMEVNPPEYLNAGLIGKGAPRLNLLERYRHPSGPDFIARNWMSVYRAKGFSLTGGLQVGYTPDRFFDDAVILAAASDDAPAAISLLDLQTGLVNGAFIPGVSSGFPASLIYENTTSTMDEYAQRLQFAARYYGFSQNMMRTRNSEQGPQRLNSIPARLRAETTLTGEIKDDYRTDATEFAVPGSKDSWELPEGNYPRQPFYPIYNEKLGVFALLETPTVEVYTKKEESRQGATCGVQFGVSQIDGEAPVYENIIDESTSFRLATDIQYAINPAARLNLERSRITAALIIDQRPFSESNDEGEYFTRDAALGNIEAIDTIPGMYATPFLPLECLGELTGYLDREHISCRGGIAWRESQPKVYLRFANTYLSARLGRNGMPLISQQVITYPVKLQTVNEPLVESPRIPFDTTLMGTVNEDIRAWRNIIVDASAEVGPIRLSAGANIEVQPSAQVDPNSQQETGIEVIIGCASPNLPYSPGELDKYCSGNTYKANLISLRGFGPQQETAFQGDSIFEASLGSPKVYPNPNTGRFTLAYSLKKTSRVQAELRDMMGRPVLGVQDPLEMEAGSYELEVDISRLRAAVYHLSITIEDQTYVRRIVKLE
ncbi:MAG: T9SS type A sorting domain-containing protein [Bacteroidota bacterium]